LCRQAAARGACRDFRGALLPRGDGRPRIIAELKKASPSKGLIRPDFDPAPLGVELAAQGAAALSVLTEPHYFQGCPQYLQTVARCVAIPVLRKDFIVDEYQIHEACAWGADAVLLIAAALDATAFRALYHVARAAGLAVLCEVHTRDELRDVLDVGAEIVGINSRDLRTFKVDLATAETLAAAVPRGIVTVAESGIATREDIARLQRAGIHAFLIGETLMRQPSPGQALRQLLSD
jgi:indole-3-glycerol phosphate synthase